MQRLSSFASISARRITRRTTHIARYATQVTTPHSPRQLPFTDHNQQHHHSPPTHHATHKVLAVAAEPTRVEVTPDDVFPLLKSRVTLWIDRSVVRKRLIRFGIEPKYLPSLLKAFANDVKSGEAFRNNEHYGPAEVARIATDLSSPRQHLFQIDRTLTTLFYSWAARPHRAEFIQSLSSPATRDLISKLHKAVDFTTVADSFPEARVMRRKIIMHVGPTNSGKTYHALRALAAAPVGAYAGPLRLLAHEIYERLNTGQIVPAGIDPEAQPELADDTSNLDIPAGETKPAIRKIGDPRYIRPCSMITGEDVKLIPHANLYACTIEMIATSKRYDVVVIDEIQMITDSERGHSWTSAVLGTAASELHLCGEDTAVPIIEALAKMTGDELIVNRYERLSPLEIAEESLDGDLTKVTKGDCIVTFSRSKIFQLKDAVEKKTALKCAVAYGRLPPEMRNEQARQFNDPDSKIDVLIGSDAIGMGLNLKIRRVIISSMTKFDGERETRLSTSQTKQIAGRAGRFGMEASGIATTLHPADLPLLREAINAPSVPLRYARVGWLAGFFEDVMAALPPGATLSTAREALIYASVVPTCFEMMDSNDKSTSMVEFVDSIAKDLPVAERHMLSLCPFPFQDAVTRDIMGNLFATYRDQAKVDLRRLLETDPHAQRILGLLNQVLEAMEDPEGKLKEEIAMKTGWEQHLIELESLHKVLVAYSWLHMHRSLAFFSNTQAVQLRDATEKAMDFCLRAKNMKRAVGGKGKKGPPRAMHEMKRQSHMRPNVAGHLH